MAVVRGKARIFWEGAVPGDPGARRVQTPREGPKGPGISGSACAPGEPQHTDPTLQPPLAALYNWRDEEARTRDESTAYILARAGLVALARDGPVTAVGVQQAVGRKARNAMQQAQRIAGLIKVRPCWSGWLWWRGRNPWKPGMAKVSELQPHQAGVGVRGCVMLCRRPPSDEIPSTPSPPTREPRTRRNGSKPWRR